MIITTFIIRGLRSRLKRKKDTELITQNNIEFLELQETKMESIANNLCYSLWGSEDCE